MKASNRFLLGFGLGILALVIVTVALVISTSNNVSMLPADTPEGVVQRFLQAVRDGDYPEAYTYLRINEKGVTLSYDEWYKSVTPYAGSEPDAWRATLDRVSVTENTATVDVIIDTFQPGAPFENPINTNTVRFTLNKIEGTWYINARPPMYYFR